MKKPPALTFLDIPREKTDFEYLRSKLKLKNIEAKDSFKKKYPHVDKFFKEKGLEISKLRQHSAKVIGAGALTGTLLFAPPTGIRALPSPQEIVDSLKDLKINNDTPNLPQKLLVDALKDLLPERTRPLDRSEEKSLEQIFENVVGVKTKANLDGEHLNTTYGLIGAEQHLKRYPGDVVPDQAPGRGAWGYFASSKAALTPQLEET